LIEVAAWEGDGEDDRRRTAAMKLFERLHGHRP
jgi:hypothetical protein